MGDDMTDLDSMSVFESMLTDDVCIMVDECVTKSVDALINSCVTKQDVVLYFDCKVRDVLSKYSDEDINKIIRSKDPLQSKTSIVNLLRGSGR
jgi:hypothetical protein